MERINLHPGWIVWLLVQSLIVFCGLQLLTAVLRIWYVFYVGLLIQVVWLLICLGQVFKKPKIEEVPEPEVPK